MKSYNNLYIKLCSYENLYLAYEKAKKHKTNKSYVIKFEKNLEFNKQFIIGAVVLIIDALVSVILAIVTKNPVSLVWGLTAGTFMELTISLLFIEPKPKLKFDAGKIKEIINRGKWVTAFGFFDYLFREGDDIIVGKLLNTQALGLYQVAYKMCSSLINVLLANSNYLQYN